MYLSLQHPYFLYCPHFRGEERTKAQGGSQVPDPSSWRSRGVVDAGPNCKRLAENYSRDEQGTKSKSPHTQGSAQAYCFPTAL